MATEDRDEYRHGRSNRSLSPNIRHTMLGPVHWGSFSGEDLERAMAVLVAQDYPDTLRRVPASGDGGIDLMVPDHGGYEVRQVKRFTQRIGKDERRQIASSWNTLIDNPRLVKPITAYRLVMPVDPTPDEQEWFEKLVSDAPWPATWWGEVHWHDLASRHPHVIDYFFGGGRERVAWRARALQARIGDPTRPITAIDVVASLEMMQVALNREDPHYRYDLRTSATMPLVEDLNGYAMAETHSLVDGGYVTILVTPKHRYSHEDAPIGGTLTATMPDGEESEKFREKWNAFQLYGRALDLPEGFLSANITAPGGLGGSFDGGRGWIGPALNNEKRDPMRIVVVSEAGEARGELTMKVEQVTTGFKGGAEIHLVDASNLLRGVIQLSTPDDDGNQTVGFTFEMSDITGCPVNRVMPVVRLVSQLDGPNEFQLRPEYGNLVMGRTTLPEGASFITQSGLLHLEDLAILQRYATQPVAIPEEIDRPFAIELHEYADMLRGEEVTGTWNEITLNLNPGVTRSAIFSEFPAPGVLAMEAIYYLTFGGEVIELGTFITMLASAQLAKDQPEDSSLARLVPGEDRTYLRRVGPLLPEKR